MKFPVAILFTFALALGVQSSVIPLSHIAGGGLSYTAVSSPVIASPWGPWGHGIVAAPHAAVAVHAPHAAVAVHASSLAVHAAPSVAVHAPAVAVHAPAVAVHAPAVAVHAPVHAPVVVPGVQGSYVAQTRGAVHTAPLSGHANSVANVNLAPAPGTI